MKRIAICVVLAAFISPIWAQVNLGIYEVDGITPFNNRSIPVGAQLKLIVASDSQTAWSGGVFLSGQNRELGLLEGSGKDSETLDWTGCHFAEAGPYALVLDWDDSLIQGYDFYSSDSNFLAGNWFVIDYTATAPGMSNVGFYDYGSSWDDPTSTVVISQVPACDFNADGHVNLLDFTLLSTYWQNMTLPPNGQIVDLDGNGVVDVNDLMEFTDYWLWEPSVPIANMCDPNSGGQEPNVVEPNFIQPPADPNMIYRIVDGNGSNEVTINVGDSVTLYVDMMNVNSSTLWSFSVEADLSDPNLGSIDNRAYDPNNPPGPGTAQILADPNRWDIFDNWGPGVQQQEGIYFGAVSASGAFDDGHLASFVFTCQGSGDVVINLINYDSTSTSGESLYPTLEGIMIHQVEPMPESMAMSSSPESAMGFSGESLAAQESVVMLSPEVATAQEPAESVSKEEMVQFLNDIWQEDSSLQETMSPKEWDAFIKSVEESYQY